MLKNQVYFILFISGLFLAIISPMLFSDGMFMDGLYYANIARNWAEGLGTFWKPHLTNTLGNPFFEHPPLVFFIQGLFFKLLGDFYWVERAYSLLTHAAMGFILWKLWKAVAIKKHHHLFWLPLFFWLMVARVSWSVCNNVIENTLMLFTSIAVLLMIKSLKSDKVYKFAFAGFFLFLGFLTKGFVAFFPLSFVFFYWVFKKEFKFLKLFKSYVFLFLGLIAPFLFIYLFIPEGVYFFEEYLNIQVLASIENVVTVDSRFFILRKFFEESLVMIIATVLLILLNKFVFRYEFKHSKEDKVWLFSLGCLALSGVLPILISMKQNTFYINTVWPIEALVFSLISAKVLKHLIAKINWQGKGFLVFKSVAVLIFVTSIILNVMASSKVGRDKNRLSDLQTIVNVAGEGTILAVGDEKIQEYSIHAYLFRNWHVSMTNESPEKRKFLIKAKGNQSNIPEGFEILRNDLYELDLYQRK